MTAQCCEHAAGWGGIAICFPPTIASRLLSLSLADSFVCLSMVLSASLLFSLLHQSLSLITCSSAQKYRMYNPTIIDSLSAWVPTGTGKGTIAWRWSVPGEPWAERFSKGISPHLHKRFAKQRHIRAICRWHENVVWLGWIGRRKKCVDFVGTWRKQSACGWTGQPPCNLDNCMACGAAIVTWWGKAILKPTTPTVKFSWLSWYNASTQSVPSIWITRNWGDFFRFFIPCWAVTRKPNLWNFQMLLGAGAWLVPFCPFFYLRAVIVVKHIANGTGQVWNHMWFVFVLKVNFGSRNCFEPKYMFNCIPHIVM